MILNDPDVHADRFSGPADIMIRKPGWYAIRVRYFQRKGTATLALYWQEPGSTEFVIIPMAVYAHQVPAVKTP